jgi:hypothetical protein
MRAQSRFRANAPLPKDTQELWDKATTMVGRNRLAVAAAVLDAGLVYSLPNWLSVPELYWEQMGDSGNVRVVMDPASRMDASLPVREGKRMPVPAIIADFQLGARERLAAERAGVPLDTTLFEQHTRRVNEQIEDLFINGWANTANGNSIYGLLTAPNAETQAYTGNEAWDNAGHTGLEILTDVLAMAEKLRANQRPGPYTLFIPTLYELKLGQDYSTSYTRTIRSRLEELQFGGQNLRIVVADQLPANRTALVQMTSETIQAVVGQQPTPISWSDGPGWNTNYAVLACVLPRIRDDYADASGICLGNTT